MKTFVASFLILFFMLSLSYAEAEEKPLIFLSGHVSVQEGGKLTSSKSVMNMKALLEQHGAEVSLVNETDDHRKPDGIILMGNSYDIDPIKYGQKPHPKTRSESEQFDRSDRDFEAALLRSDIEYNLINWAKENKTPIFGVCGGMQRINVAYGGSLVQHVEGQVQLLTPANVPVENIDIIDNTKLSEIAGKQSNLLAPDQNEDGDAMVNSLHHQAVDELGQGLKKSAISSHGTVEAIEGAGEHYIVGVQWHPEHLPDSPLTEKLVVDFIEAAKASKLQN